MILLGPWAGCHAGGRAAGRTRQTKGGRGDADSPAPARCAQGARPLRRPRPALTAGRARGGAGRAAPSRGLCGCLSERASGRGRALPTPVLSGAFLRPRPATSSGGRGSGAAGGGAVVPAGPRGAAASSATAAFSALLCRPPPPGAPGRPQALPSARRSRPPQLGSRPPSRHWPSRPPLSPGPPRSPVGSRARTSSPREPRPHWPPQDGSASRESRPLPASPRRHALWSRGGGGPRPVGAHWARRSLRRSRRPRPLCAQASFKGRRGRLPLRLRRA